MIHVARQQRWQGTCCQTTALLNSTYWQTKVAIHDPCWQTTALTRDMLPDNSTVKGSIFQENSGETCSMLPDESADKGSLASSLLFVKFVHTNNMYRHILSIQYVLVHILYMYVREFLDAKIKILFNFGRHEICWFASIGLYGGRRSECLSDILPFYKLTLSEIHRTVNWTSA